MAIVEEEFETTIKVIVVGNGSVGKTSLIRRFCTGAFTDNYKKTIGVDFLERELFIDSQGEAVRMMIWDTAGQEEFDAITRTYYRGAGACIFIFSTTDRASFEAIEGWKTKVEAECGDICQVLVQNKSDLLSQSVVQPKEAEDLATRMGVRFYRASVKDDVNVSQVFNYLAERYLECGGADSTMTVDQSQAAVQAASASGNEGASASGAADATDSGAGASSNKNTNVTQEPFKLGPPLPSKQRTGGKKSKCF